MPWASPPRTRDVRASRRGPFDVPRQGDVPVRRASRGDAGALTVRDRLSVATWARRPWPPVLLAHGSAGRLPLDDGAAIREPSWLGRLLPRPGASDRSLGEG